MLKHIAQHISRIGFSANAATISGLLFSCVAFFLIIEEQFIQAAVALAVSGFFDLLDGSIARYKGVKNQSGALLDSSLDRYSDAVVFIAIACYFASLNANIYLALSLSAMIGSFEISYVRARAEGLGQTCYVGFWERGERIVFIFFALILGNLEMLVIILGIFTHVTAVTRMIYAYKKLAAHAKASRDNVIRKNRLGAKHIIVTALLLFIIAFVRP